MEPTKRQVCSSSVQVPCQSHADVEAWSATTKAKKKDCLAMGYASLLPEKVSIDLEQNDLSQLEEIWKRIKEPGKQRFIRKYGQITSLILVKVEEPLIKVALQLWDLSHKCFTFNKEDLTPTIEEFSTLLQIDLQCPDKIYVRKTNLGFRKKLAKIMKIKLELIDPHTKEKGGNRGIEWDFIRRFIMEHLNDDQGLDAFALAMYGLIIFPRVTGYIEVAVVDFFEQIQNRCNPSLVILAKTFRSLNFCCQNTESRFVRCLPMLYIWLRSHLPCKKSAFVKPYLPNSLPIEEFCNSE